VYLSFSWFPPRPYFKLVDVWLLFCVVAVVLAILLHTALAAIFGEKITRSRPQMAFHRIRSASGSVNENEKEEDDNGAAKVANYVAMGGFVALIVLFNIVFWAVALKEYNMDKEQLLDEKRPPIR
jgi:flagellar basal body-associated protein FliL